MNEQEQQPQNEVQEVQNVQMEPTPPSPPPSHKKLMVGIVVVFVLAVVGIAGAYLFYSGIFTKNILAKTAEAALSIQSYSQEITVKVEKDGETIIVNGNVEVDVFSEKVKSTFEISLEQFKITSESILIDDDVFVKVNINNPILKELLSFPDDWIQLNINDIPEEYTNMVDDNLKFSDSLALFREGGEYLTILEEYGEEQLNGNTVLHYTLSLSPDFASTVSQQNLRDFYEELANNGTIDVWVNDDNFYIQKIKFITPTFTSAAEIKNINQAVDIQRPIKLISYEEWKSVLSDTLSTLEEARKKSRDAKRIVDIKLLRLALELYYDSYGGYPAMLSVLAPEFIQQVPNDSLDSGICRPDYCYAYSGDFKSYHIGAQLEDANHEALAQDEDFNSKNAGYSGAPFNGADTVPLFDEVSF